MGNRISKVYTRTGDDGTTGTADGGRVSKDSVLMQAIGDIDELNSSIGVLRAESLPGFMDESLKQIQHELFNLGGELAMPEFQSIKHEDVQRLESELDQWNAKLEPLKDFILPAGNRQVALSHLARTVCRRAERSLVTLSSVHEMRTEMMQYVNRLSDYLFVAARLLADDADLEEIMWDPENSLGY